MSAGILLMTHNRIGEELLGTARETLGFMPVQTASVAVSPGSDPEERLAAATAAADRVETGDGVLVLTDCYGSTPSNIATRLAHERPVVVIAGVNLPMLLRVFNYPALPLAELADKARSGGRDGVILVEMLRRSKEY
ncbi:MAG: PTS fructose transporter subunit IIA [Ectothiorhodospiraceae bacterium]